MSLAYDNPMRKNLPPLIVLLLQVWGESMRAESMFEVS